MNDLDRQIERDVQNLGLQSDTLHIEVVKWGKALIKCKVALGELQEPLRWFVEEDALDTDALHKSLPLVNDALKAIKECGIT